MTSRFLFDDKLADPGAAERLGTQSFVLRGFALSDEKTLWQAVQQVLGLSPWRQMWTPGGRLMSTEQTNCGQLGWITDNAGYRYVAEDPLTRQPWPAMPASFRDLAFHAASEAGFRHFGPDACLMNRYGFGAKMGLHQDKDELDLSAPIVSVSLGLTARFMFGGLRRTDPVQSVLLAHGDTVVWGGRDRLRFHGVAAPLKGEHGLCGPYRVNLTFRLAGAAIR